MRSLILLLEFDGRLLLACCRRLLAVVFRRCVRVLLIFLFLRCPSDLFLYSFVHEWSAPVIAAFVVVGYCERATLCRLFCILLDLSCSLQSCAVHLLLFVLVHIFQ